MRIDIDRARCEGHGQCEAAAPGLIALDDDAAPVFAFDEVPPELEDEAATAVLSCPVAALSLSR